MLRQTARLAEQPIYGRMGAMGGSSWQPRFAYHPLHWRARELPPQLRPRRRLQEPGGHAKGPQGRLGASSATIASYWLGPLPSPPKSALACQSEWQDLSFNSRLDRA